MQFVFDLEGTICFEDQPVPDSITYSLECLVQKGHEVIFSSSRPIRDMLPLLAKRFHGNKMIGRNGAILCHNGNVKPNVVFDEETLESIRLLMKEHKVTYFIEGEWDYSYTGPADHPIAETIDPNGLGVNKPLDKLEHVVKITIVTSFNMAILRKKLDELNVIIHTHYQLGMLDITPCGIQKWKALKKLGIEKGAYITFGDDEYDIPVFEHAKHSVMVGDHPLLALYADECISKNQLIEEQIVEKLEELDQRFAY